MRFEDVRAGQRLKDPYGNVYEVQEIADAPKRVASLKCIKWSRAVTVEYTFAFERTDQSWWVHADREYLLDGDDPAVKQIITAMGLSGATATFYDVEFAVIAKGITKYFKVVRPTCIEGCEVTIADMQLLPEHIELDSAITPDDIEIGTRLQDTRGNEYVVVTRYDLGAMLYCYKDVPSTMYYGCISSVGFGETKGTLSLDELSLLEV